jgi:hypothetical protein
MRNPNPFLLIQDVGPKMSAKPIGQVRRKLDLRPGGELLYAMTATAPQQVEFTRREGMPVTTEGCVTYAEVVPPRRLAYTHLADFIPGVESYDVATVVELCPG